LAASGLTGIALGLVLALPARPLVVELCLLPVRESIALEVGDQVHLLIAPEQIHAVSLLFGLREED